MNDIGMKIINNNFLLVITIIILLLGVGLISEYFKNTSNSNHDTANHDSGAGTHQDTNESIVNKPALLTPQEKYDSLANLKRLKDADVLTEDEYAKEKQKILNT